MKLTGSYQIAAPPQTVWQALTDPQSLQACIPGCQRLNHAGNGNYEAAITAAMGPVRGNFNAKIAMLDQHTHQSYRLSISANGPPGFINGEAHVTLSPAPNSATTVTVDADGQAGGLIARVGQRMMENAARNMMDRFFNCLAESATKNKP